MPFYPFHGVLKSQSFSYHHLSTFDRDQIECAVLRYLEGERPCEFSSDEQQLQQQIHLVGDADEQSLHQVLEKEPTHQQQSQLVGDVDEQSLHQVLEKDPPQASEELVHHQAQSQQPDQQPEQQQQQHDGFNSQQPLKTLAQWTKLHLYNPLHDGRAERNPHYMRWLHRTPEQELENQRVVQEREKRRARAQEQQRDDSSDSEGWIPPHRKFEPRLPPRPRKKTDTAKRARIAPLPAVVQRPWVAPL